MVGWMDGWMDGWIAYCMQRILMWTTQFVI